jgi:hypothetical protein
MRLSRFGRLTAATWGVRGAVWPWLGKVADFSRWRPLAALATDGKEIFFAALDLKMMAAEIVETDATLSIGKVLPLFQMNPVLGAGNAYDVTPDGKKFIVNSGTAQESTAPLTLVVNWTSLLKK